VFAARTRSVVRGSDRHRSHRSAHHTGLLRLPHQDVLETTQGQTVQEGRQGRRRHEERSDAHQRHEGEGTRGGGGSSGLFCKILTGQRRAAEVRNVYPSVDAGGVT